MTDFVHEYWSKTQFGRAMLASKYVSDSDLLFLIPNNVKRRNGLPVTRIYGKRKSKIKKDRIHKILLFPVYDTLDKAIREIFGDGPFITDLVEIKGG